MFTVLCDNNRTFAGRMAMGYATWLRQALVLEASMNEIVQPDAPETIFVSHLPLEEALSRCPEGGHLLLPLQENGRRQAVHHGSICLPFGSRGSSLHSARIAFALAKRMGVGVVATHTTFRHRGNASNDPLYHMTEGSHTIFRKLTGMSGRFNVPTRFDVRMADEIPNFVIGVAVETGCGLIVMARGDVLYGSNAVRVATHSHLPVLIVAKSSDREVVS